MKSSTRGEVQSEGDQALRVRARTRTILGVGVRRLLGALTTSGAAALAIAACADATGINVAPGGAEPVSDEQLDRCGAGAVACGVEGCCTAGSECVAGACIPATPCEDHNQCSGDSACGPGRCVTWTAAPEGRQFDATCREPVELDQVRPEVQCRWPKADAPPAEHPLSVQVIGTPMVVDFNFDGSSEIQPSIVFVSYEGGYGEGNGVLRIIDGSTCDLQATIDKYRFIPEVPVALGDMNGDGHPEIVAGDRDNSGAAIQAGVSVWSVDTGSSSPAFVEIGQRSTLGNSALIKGLAIHDLDDALPPEVLTENTLFEFDAEEGLKPLDFIDDRDSAFEAPVVVDINLDQQHEMVTSQGIMMWDREALQLVNMRNSGGGPVWAPESNVLGSFLALADLGDFRTGLPGGGDSVEMVVVNGDGVAVRKVDGDQVFGDTTSTNNGPPVIADFDGDGKMEFAVPGRDGTSAAFTVYDLDCVQGASFADEADCGGGDGTPSRDGVLWRKRGLRGARSGAAVFDFDGDGKTEVVQADQCYMRVYDGVTGNVLFSAPRRSTTQWEYPVVADVDGDSYSEIVTASNADDTSVGCPETDTLNTNATVELGEPFSGITVWKDEKDHWMGSRPVWNQQNYYVTNVGDDGSIPEMSEVQSHWNTGQGEVVPNTFRRNVQGSTGSSLRRADITTSAIAELADCGPDGRATVDAYVCNRGLESVEAGRAEVAFIAGDQPTNVLCTESNASAMAPGECRKVSCRLPPRGQLRFDVIVTGDPRTQIAECWEGNNASTIAGVFCPGPVQ